MNIMNVQTHFSGKRPSESNISSQDLLNFYKRQGIGSENQNDTGRTIVLHDQRLGKPIQVPKNLKQLSNNLLARHAKILGISAAEFKKALTDRHTTFSIGV